MSDQKCGRIPLRDRSGIVRAEALVDATDAHWLARWSWCLNGGGINGRTRYAGRRTLDRILLMHRQILGLEWGDPREGDHRDHNGLNNRRSNLRIVTHAQGQQNLPAMGGASRFRGVSWDSQTGKWRATAKFEGRYYSLGRYTNEVKAALAAHTFRTANMPFAEPDPTLLAEGHIKRTP